MAALSSSIFWSLLKASAVSWKKHNAARFGAALGFYTIFAVSPLAVIGVAIAGSIFGEETARAELLGQIRSLAGSAGADAVEVVMKSAADAGKGIIAAGIAAVMLVVGATTVFAELQEALNAIWEVKPRPGKGIVLFLKKRLLSFAIVVGIGFLLLVSLVLSASLSAFSHYFGGDAPGSTPGWTVAYAMVSFVIITLLFAMIYKILPDMRIAWRDVWLGAVITATLFTVGKYFVGLYLGQSNVISAYGASGSLVVLLLWVYYSAQIVFFGAEFTRQYTYHRELRVVPEPEAMRTSGPTPPVI
jgi:membrane protein